MDDVNISDDLDQLAQEAENLLSDGVEAPPLYRDLSTEYADLGRLLQFLEGRSFSGLVRVVLERGEVHILVFRGRAYAAKYGADGRSLAGAEAMSRALVDARAAQGKISVHELPDELFPESWWEREPIAVDLAPPHVEATPVEPGEEAPAVQDHPLNTETAPSRAELPVEKLAPSHPEPAQGTAATDGASALTEPVPIGSGAVAETPPTDHAPPATEAVPSGPVGDAKVWVGLIEHMHGRFKKFRGPALAARLEAAVNTLLGESGVRLNNGKITGRRNRSHGALQAAGVGCAAYVRQVAGQAFVEKSLSAAFRDLRVEDSALYREALRL